MSSNKPSSVVRYLVEFWDAPTVGYNTGIGASTALKCAMYTAKNYGGRVISELSNGTSEEIASFGGQRQQNSSSETKETAAPRV